MQRITLKQLESLVTHLNKLTNNPVKTYEKKGQRLESNIGNYHISQAYGGCELHQIMNKSGGVSTPLYTGHVPKRQLFDAIHIFIRGIETCI